MEEDGTTQVVTDETVAEEPQDRKTFVTTSEVERRESMASLFKAYWNDEGRYLGSMTDSFDQKFRLFKEISDQADIPENDQHGSLSFLCREFSTVLLWLLIAQESAHDGTFGCQ